MKYPIKFKVKSTSHSGIKEKWYSSYKEGKIQMSIPRCFEGEGGGLSPEDIYAMSLLNCYLATFKVVAEKSKLNFEKIEGEAQLDVDLSDAQVPWMSKVEIKINLYRPDNPGRAQRILEKAAQNSMIINSVKSKVNLNWKIT